MKKIFIYGLSLFFLFPITMGSNRAYSSSDDEVAPQKTLDQRAYFKKGINSRLYLALRLIDDRSNWLRVSELLRDVLKSDLDDPFMRNHLEKAKWQVDSEFIVDKVEERVVDWPYVVAKLRIIEALMANHVKLNVSYDREVPLIKGLLQSYFFPGQEEDGEIIFPNPQDYRSDIYGYVKENILKTDSSRSGEINDPRFPPVKKAENDKKKVPGATPGIPNVPGVPSNSGSPHGRPNAVDSQGNRVALSPLQPGQPNFMTPKEAEESLKLLKEIFSGAKELYNITYDEIKELFDVVKIQNQYEPWAMLLQVIANPDSIYEDPQLRDFANGVKLRLKLTEYEFVPEEQAMFKNLFEFDQDYGLRVEEEVNSDTGKATMYVVSNLAGPGMIHLKYILYLKTYLELHSTVVEWAEVATNFATWLKGFGESASLFQKAVRLPVWVSGRVALGGMKIIPSVLANGKVQQFLKYIETTRAYKFTNQNALSFVKAALVVSMVGDLVEGAFQYLAARDKYERIEAIQDVLAKEVATSIYALPLISRHAVFKYLGWGAFTLDAGHLISPSIPNTSTTIKTVFGEYIPYYISKWTTGYSMYDLMIADYERQFEIRQNDAPDAIVAFIQMANLSQTESDLSFSKSAYEAQIKEYANRRLFMIYYMIQRFDNKSNSELGFMEQRYWENHQQYRQNSAWLKDLFDQRLEKVKND